jgi:hypothetical protein
MRRHDLQGAHERESHLERGGRFACIDCSERLQCAVHGQPEHILPISSPTSAFQILNDGTVIDSRTGLMWTQCPLGQTLSNSACAGTPSLYTWADALTTAKAQNFAGHTDWRLPNVKELLSILEDQCSHPAFNADVFPIAQEIDAWSATPAVTLLVSMLDDAWTVNYGGGSAEHQSKGQPLAVLLVRVAK